MNIATAFMSLVFFALLPLAGAVSPAVPGAVALEFTPKISVQEYDFSIGAREDFAFTWAFFEKNSACSSRFTYVISSTANNAFRLSVSVKGSSQTAFSCTLPIYFQQATTGEIVSSKATLTYSPAPSLPSQALPGGLSRLPASPDGLLRYSEKYGVAVYAFKSGDTLYSIVRRFTDYVDFEDGEEESAGEQEEDEGEENLRLSDVIRDVQARSEIRDVRSVRPGHLVRIPYKYLADDYNPDAEKKDEREKVRQAKAEPKRVASQRPASIGGPNKAYVILDIGHGEGDPGASCNGVCESTITQFIGEGVKAKLKEKGYAVTVIERQKAGLAGLRKRRNSIDAAYDHYRASSSAGNDDIVLISIHADALHPDASGSMVYVPGASYARHSGKDKAGKIKSEALSTQLAESIIEGLRKTAGYIHKDKPIRNVIRGRGRPWVPFVLQGKPFKSVLVEIGNIRNGGDLKNMRSSNHREKVALGIVAGLDAHFG